MIRLKRIDFICKRKLLLVTLLAFFLSMFVANVSADFEGTMYWKDYNGPAEGGYMPDLDQKQIFDKLTEAETSNPSIKYAGSWTKYSQPGPSGGSTMCSKDFTPPEGSVTFTFVGSSIKWIGSKGDNRGVAKVYIDNLPNPVDTVDLYNSGYQWQQELYSNNSLTSGSHTIKIEVTDSSNADDWVCVDAFVVNNDKHYCSPVAEANSLWWLDKKFGLGIFENPLEGTGYVGGDITGDGYSTVIDLVQDLAWLMDTNGQRTGKVHSGTTVEDEQAGIDAFLKKYLANPNLLLAKSLYEHTEYKPDFSFIEEEVEKSQDVKLDLGFWQILECNGTPGDGTISWGRVGAHSVTVAGVDSQNSLLAVSDPSHDNVIEAGPSDSCAHDMDIQGDPLSPECNPCVSAICSVDPFCCVEGWDYICVVEVRDICSLTYANSVLRPFPGVHPVHFGDHTVHNNEIFASHDIYSVVPSASPGGLWALEDYPGWANLPPLEQGQPTSTDWPSDFSPCNGSIISTEIEAAVVVSPIPPTVLTPPAGVVVPSGSWYAISWSWTSPKMVKFDLHYSLDDGTNWKLVRGGRTIVKNTGITDAIGIPGDGGAEVYYWKVPVPANNKIKSRVKVTGYDASGVKFAEDISDKFTIEVVKVTAPDGGEVLKVSPTNPKIVTWRTNKTSKPVTSTKVSFAKNASAATPKWVQICSFNGDNPNPGSCTWTAAGICSTTERKCNTDLDCPQDETCNLLGSQNCKVKVELKNNGTIGSDVSDRVFTISP